MDEATTELHEQMNESACTQWLYRAFFAVYLILLAAGICLLVGVFVYILYQITLGIYCGRFALLTKTGACGMKLSN